MEIEHNITLNIKRFDLNDKPETEVANLQINSDVSAEDILLEINNLLNLQENNSNVVKLRLQDNTLVPISALLDPNINSNFNVEVTRIHQNLPARNRSHLHSIYVEAVKSKIYSMNKRLSKMESLIPQVRLRREIQNERAITALSSKVAFLERRLDELTPEEWKS
ncbi:uncharacterized protein LOC123294783 isoform X1 [Chrysoperla carnea]|uniref:uncharacterized protein LOC123294783 isoform X1 n=1 Tax=Chrysoperla carnea TaxID=189513 RepID=UPI001D082E59|nr:uncharacterized protein LOC123294783 isoform X1 [Chrysoperla carnea]